MTATAGRSAVVVGAGITGLVTACRLAETGWQVTVIEARSGPGEGSSRGNAGQLLFDRIGAMGSPGFLRALPRTLTDRSQGIGALGLARPDRWGWTARFLRQCSSAAWRRNTARMLELARQSRDGFHGFRDRHAIDFDWRRPGKLVVQPSAEALAGAAANAAFEAQFGGRHEVVSAEDCLAREPALAGGSRAIAGAIYLPDAEVGDCHAFCAGLARVLVGLGGTLRYDTEVTGLRRSGGRVVAVDTPTGPVEADITVLATGPSVGRLLGGAFAGRKPVVGVRGVSLTFPAGPRPPDLSVTDAGGKFVVLRLGQRVRVAGIASFSDVARVLPGEIATLRDKARALMPEAADWGAAPDAWSGLRPQTPDDLPMIGKAGAENLYVNAGQGSLGWTFAFGSAERLLAAVAAG